MWNGTEFHIDTAAKLNALTLTVVLMRGTQYITVHRAENFIKNNKTKVFLSVDVNLWKICLHYLLT